MLTFQDVYRGGSGRREGGGGLHGGRKGGGGGGLEESDDGPPPPFGEANSILFLYKVLGKRSAQKYFFKVITSMTTTLKKSLPAPLSSNCPKRGKCPARGLVLWTPFPKSWRSYPILWCLEG